jgi:uncharacterized protein YccT (UPF0319 family)
VLDGIGSPKVGLQADDVIVSFDGHELTTEYFRPDYQDETAGDCIDVTFTVVLKEVNSNALRPRYTAHSHLCEASGIRLHQSINNTIRDRKIVAIRNQQ